MLKSIPRRGINNNRYPSFVKSCLPSDFEPADSPTGACCSSETWIFLFFSSASSFTIYFITHSSIVKLNFPAL